MRSSISSKLLSGALRLTGAGVVALAAVSAASAQRTKFSNPAMAGDHPDPSVIQVGADYYATATSSEWAPEFPILHSRDLVNWEIVGTVLPERPEWAVGNFWAPEISQYKGRYFVYYAARKKGGSLCVAVASARKPTGPYTDHGPLVCQDAGSIDGMAVVDEKGDRYLVWKEDGNSRNEPTPIWAEKLSEDGTKLVGDRKELIRNTAPWEAQLVEGPFVMRKNGWFYMFYAANACCGRECNYATGVARAKSLLGPWEKNPSNPILGGNAAWKCPGHGSVVETRGRDFFLYHAYSAKDGVYVGRQALLDEVQWGQDGWPAINNGNGPSEQVPSPFGTAQAKGDYTIAQPFDSSRLASGWQWPQGNEPSWRVSGGWLTLSPARGASADAVLACSTTAGDYAATTAVDVRSAQGLVGLSAYGDSENNLGVGLRDGKVVVWRKEKNDAKTISTVDAPTAKTLWLKMTATGGHRFRFAVSANPKTGSWTEVGEEVEGDYLPPWDRGIRVALVASGSPGAFGRFDFLDVVPR
jgi:beta-xylosidase